MTSAIRCALLISLSAFWPAQNILKITYPASGAIVHPGETISIYLSVSGPPLTMANIIAWDPIPSSQLLTGPPYQFAITIPTRITPGLYFLTAVGRTATSDLLSSEPVPIDVERPDSPEKITLFPPRLDLSIGHHSSIAVSGTYKDGSIVDLTKSTQTKYFSQSPEIATVTNEGLVSAITPGTTHVIIDGILSVPVTVEPHLRIFPTEATIKAGQTRTFIARLDNPPDGAVTWRLDPSLGTYMDSVYTAPAALDSKQTVTLQASSVADPNLTATAIITLSPVASVSIVPSWAVLYGEQTQKFNAIASNAGNAGLAWSINPSSAGAIDPNGLYTAPGYIPKLQSVKVTATSVANPTISGSTTIWISPHPFVMFLPSLEIRAAPGASSVMKVTLLASDGFWHPIALSAQGLPAGVTGTFSQTAMKGNNSSSLTLAISSAAAPGSYTITVVAQDTISTTLSESQSLTLIVK
jgi:hypothetical protein